MGCAAAAAGQRLATPLGVRPPSPRPSGVSQRVNGHPVHGHERTHVKLHKRLMDFSSMALRKKSSGADQLHRSLGITYESVWLMPYRPREPMRAAGSCQRWAARRGGATASSSASTARCWADRLRVQAAPSGTRRSRRCRSPSTPTYVALQPRAVASRVWHERTHAPASLRRGPAHPAPHRHGGRRDASHRLKPAAWIVKRWHGKALRAKTADDVNVQRYTRCRWKMYRAA